MGLSDADSAENGSTSQNAVITPISCSLPPPAGTPKLSGLSRIRVTPGSLLQKAYGQTEVEEGYFCNYEVNPRYEPEYERTGLKIVARGGQNEARAVELDSHRFFLATLFQPQLSSSAERPHPVVNAFLQAASRFATHRRSALA